MCSELGAGQVLELRADQVLRRAVAVGAVVQLAGLRLGQRHQLGHVLGRRAGVDHQHVGHQRDRGDRREVLLEVVGQLLVDAGGDGVVHRAHQQRVAVGLGLGHVVGAQRGAGAGLALDDHGLAEALRQLLGQRARQHVGGAAGREGHDQADRLGWARPAPWRCRCARRERQGGSACSRRRRARLRVRAVMCVSGLVVRGAQAAWRCAPAASRPHTAWVTSAVVALPPRSRVCSAGLAVTCLDGLHQRAARPRPRPGARAASRTDQKVPTGLARPLPMMSKAEPWIGSNIDG